MGIHGDGARPVSHAPPVSQHRGISFWHHDAAHGERTHHLPLHGAAGGLRTDYSAQPSHLPCPNHLPRHVGSEVDTAGDNHCQLRHYHIHLRQHRRCHKPPDSDNIRTRGSVHLRAGRTDKAWHTQPTDRERRLPHHNQPASRSFPHDQARTAILYTIGKGRHEWQRRKRILRPPRRAHRGQLDTLRQNTHRAPEDAPRRHIHRTSHAHTHRKGGMPPYHWGEDPGRDSGNTRQEHQQHKLRQDTHTQKARPLNWQRPEGSTAQGHTRQVGGKNYPYKQEEATLSL